MALHSASKGKADHQDDNSSGYTQISSNYNQPYTDAKQILATLSNTYSLEHEPSLSLDLVMHQVSWSDFLATFYKNGNGFNISLYNVGLNVLCFAKQKYRSAGSDYKLNLINELLKAYVNKHNVLETEVSPCKRMKLTLEMNKLQSLASLVGSMSLSLDGALNQLTTSNQIIHTGELDHSAHVTFQVYSIIHSHVLDTSIGVFFNYNTTIPCYRNVYTNDDHCLPNPYHNHLDKSFLVKLPEPEISKQKLRSSLLLDDLTMVEDDEDDDDDDSDSGNTTIPSKKVW